MEPKVWVCGGEDMRLYVEDLLPLVTETQVERWLSGLCVF